MRIETGIYIGKEQSAADGWKILLEQEKTPFRITTKPDCPVIVCERDTPPWMEEYLKAGGVMIVTGAQPASLCFPVQYVGDASLEEVDLADFDRGKARVQSICSIFDGKGRGKLTLHEKRLPKFGMHPDEFPVVLFEKIGDGGCWYTGVPMSALISVLGDTLRQTDSFSDFSERVVSVDKHHLLHVMRCLLVDAFTRQGLPYVHLGYYPDQYQSLFAFRVDVDGIYGENLELLSKAGKENGIPISFYVNQKMCEPEAEWLNKIDPFHDIGNHGVLHNLYTSLEDNRRNVGQCRDWMNTKGIENGPWYVAPRGMWNFNLHRALAEEGYEFTSDFGFCIFGLPFYPYFNGERMQALQIPINPFSTERAYAKAEEENGQLPTAPFVADYFIKSVEEQYTQGMPIILYSHPQRFGPLSSQVFPQLKARVDSLNIWQTTLPEIYTWWSQRDAVQYSAEWTRDKLQIQGDIPEHMQVKTILGVGSAARGCAG